MRVYHDFFWVPGSRSTFPDADPDPAKWYGSGQMIRIRPEPKHWKKHFSSFISIFQDSDIKGAEIQQALIEK